MKFSGRSLCGWQVSNVTDASDPPRERLITASCSLVWRLCAVWGWQWWTEPRTPPLKITLVRLFQLVKVRLPALDTSTHIGGGQAAYTQYYIGNKGSLSSGQAVCRCKVTRSKHCDILHNMIITIVLDHFLYTISSNYLTMLWHYITLKSLRNKDLYLYKNWQIMFCVIKINNYLQSIVRNIYSKT